MFLLLFLLLIIFPIAELYVIIKVGEAIGVLPTLALLIVDGFVGAALARSQGRAVVARFQQAMNEGRVPAKEAFDGAMVAIGGALLLAPGFITDVFGVAAPDAAEPRRDPNLRRSLGQARRRLDSLRASAAGRGRGGQGAVGAPAASTGMAAPARRATRSAAAAQPDYDYEGTAQEVTDPPPELDDGASTGAKTDGRRDG